jgi:hypothetical protein
VLAAIDRDANTVAVTTSKLHPLVTLTGGYIEVVRADHRRRSGRLILRGMARLRPYPGSTTVAGTPAWSAWFAPRSTCAHPGQLHHPGIVGDSPFWADKPLGVIIANTHWRLHTAEVVGARSSVEKRASTALI